MGSTHERFRVGDLELDSGTVTLRREGEEIALPRPSFELLFWLAPMVLLAVIAIAFLVVTQNFVTQTNGPVTSISPIGQEHLRPGSLPEPITNNAVAEFTQNGVQYLMSFMGLGPGKEHEDISKKAWLWRSDTAAWEPFPDVPVEQGRLAAVAVGLYDRVLLFGGYTVAPDGTEQSTPEVFIINPLDGSYKPRAEMPVPVDDAVAFAYANRYIYLVSGWHDEGNVSHVQVYDTWEDNWAMADAFPGTPVFGHAGGIVGNQFVIVGGVGVLGVKGGKRQFGAINQAWLGEIDPENPQRISWSELPLLEETAQYRMAATGDESSGLVLFAGGSRRPYNFNGIGYDGLPAEPEDSFFAWDTASATWVYFPEASRVATMDHRGLLRIGNEGFATVGGMTAGQEVTGRVVAVPIQVLRSKTPVQPD